MSTPLLTGKNTIEITSDEMRPLFKKKRRLVKASSKIPPTNSNQIIYPKQTKNLLMPNPHNKPRPNLDLKKGKNQKYHPLNHPPKDPTCNYLPSPNKAYPTNQPTPILP